MLRMCCNVSTVTLAQHMKPHCVLLPAEWNGSIARLATNGNADKILFGDEAFDKALGMLILERLRESAVLGVAVECDYQR